MNIFVAELRGNGIFFVICTRFEGIQIRMPKGEMLEWLKRHAGKACKRQKRFGGSNPPLSAVLNK